MKKHRNKSCRVSHISQYILFSVYAIIWNTIIHRNVCCVTVIPQDNYRSKLSSVFQIILQYEGLGCASSAMQDSLAVNDRGINSFFNQCGLKCTDIRNTDITADNLLYGPHATIPKHLVFFFSPKWSVLSSSPRLGSSVLLLTEAGILHGSQTRKSWSAHCPLAPCWLNVDLYLDYLLLSFLQYRV